MPNTFNVRVVHGFVRVVILNPATDTFNITLPFMNITQDRRATCFIKNFYPNFVFYLRLIFKTKLLLNHIFYRKTVAVPTPTSAYMIPLHRLVTWYHIFDDVGVGTRSEEHTSE